MAKYQELVNKIEYRIKLSAEVSLTIAECVKEDLNHIASEKDINLVLNDIIFSKNSLIDEEMKGFAMRAYGHLFNKIDEDSLFIVLEKFPSKISFILSSLKTVSAEFYFEVMKNDEISFVDKLFFARAVKVKNFKGNELSEIIADHYLPSKIKACLLISNKLSPEYAQEVFYQTTDIMEKIALLYTTWTDEDLKKVESLKFLNHGFFEELTSDELLLYGQIVSFSWADKNKCQATKISINDDYCVDYCTLGKCFTNQGTQNKLKNAVNTTSSIEIYLRNYKKSKYIGFDVLNSIYHELEHSEQFYILKNIKNIQAKKLSPAASAHKLLFSVKNFHQSLFIATRMPKLVLQYQDLVKENENPLFFLEKNFDSNKFDVHEQIWQDAKESIFNTGDKTVLPLYLTLAYQYLEILLKPENKELFVRLSKIPNFYAVYSNTSYEVAARKRAIDELSYDYDITVKKDMPNVELETAIYNDMEVESEWNNYRNLWESSILKFAVKLIRFQGKLDKDMDQLLNNVEVYVQQLETKITEKDFEPFIPDSKKVNIESSESEAELVTQAKDNALIIEASVSEELNITQNTSKEVSQQSLSKEEEITNLEKQIGELEKSLKTLKTTIEKQTDSTKTLTNSQDEKIQ